MNPEMNQYHSDVGSPAKRKKLYKLINFWGGGSKVEVPFKNNPTSSSLNASTQDIATTHTWHSSKSLDDPGGGQGEVDSESGQTQLIQIWRRMMEISCGWVFVWKGSPALSCWIFVISNQVIIFSQGPALLRAALGNMLWLRSGSVRMGWLMDQSEQVCKLKLSSVIG